VTVAPKPAPPVLAEPKYGGILVLANRRDPPAGFETLRFSNSELHYVTAKLNGGGHLVIPCRANVFEVCPGVAESWEHNKDFTQWTFKVRDGILWHDGTRFTAEDAKFWFDLVVGGAKVGGKTRSPAYFATGFGDVEKVEALDGNRLRVTLRHSVPQYLQTIYAGEYSIGHPRHLMQPRMEKGEIDVSPQDVGWVSIGPFKMLKYEKGSRVQVRRFDRYWERDAQGRQLPFLDGVDFAITSDPGSMDAAFRVGRVDGGALGTGHSLTKERQAGYIRDLGDQVWFAQLPSTRQNLNFNVLRTGPWQDVRVRKAMALWMDKEATITSVQGGFGHFYTILGPTNPYTSPDFMTWPGWNKATREQDRAEAKRLMAEAGYPNGRFRMTSLLRQTWVAEGEFISGQLAGLGIEVKFEVRDNAGEASGRLTLDYDSSQGGGAPFAVIPEQLEGSMTRYSISKAAAAKHEDPRVIEYFTRLKATTSFEERVRVWRELERYYMLDRVYQIALFGHVAVIPYRSYVKGMYVSQESVLNNLEFATVWLDR
jgi:peptide/nickel transport system substrate-binding protein